MVSPERLDALQGRWVRLLATWGYAPGDAYPVFDRLVTAYSEPHRFYHTLEHLAEVFRVVGRLGATPAVELAVWFHDAVYDPRATDNEERSARLVEEWLDLPADVLARVAELVRGTAHLTADATPADPELLALVDADLAILGASEARYRRYAADIRREYAHVTEEAYRNGRAAVLRAFLGRASIYRHPLLVAEGEAAARRNLTAEVASLSASE